MAANMQFNSYCPGYYTASNLNLNGNGSTWQLNRNNKVSESGNMYSTAFLSRDYVLAYNKQVLKQTMLKHETIFKAQIEELHRLYRRQRELMEEIRRNEFNNYLKPEASHSNLAFFQVATEKVHSIACSVQGNGIQLPESKCKRVGKKILDLQLPADEYIDCDDSQRVSQVSELLSYSGNKSPRVVYMDDVKPFFGGKAVNSFLSGGDETSLKERSGFSCSGFSSPASHGMYYGSSKLNSFVNSDKLPSVSTKSLLEPPTFQLGSQSLSIDRPMHGSQSSRIHSDVLQGSIFDNRVSVQINKRSSESIQFQTLREPPRRNPVAVQALPCFNNSRLSLERPDRIGDSSGGYELVISEHVQATKRTERNHGHLANGLSWIRANETCSSSKTIPDCTTEFNNLIKDVKNKAKCTVLDLNMACDSVPGSEAEELVTERKDKGFGYVIDLNSSLNEPDVSHTAEIELDAPSSPENKECSPPRGESDGNQVDADPALDDELARIAAEAIVSFSSTRLRKETPSSRGHSLNWFAGVACLMAGESRPLLNNDDEEEEEMDYFEAMTLKLVEMKAEECYYNNKSKCLETGTATALSRGRGRRGRQQKRKDFQREILPSLASLSRYEVNEDLQTIMEAAGAARRSRPRRRNSASVSPESLLKQVGDERSVICWGKVTRRRRGQRYPVRVSTTNQQHLILATQL